MFRSLTFTAVGIIALTSCATSTRTAPATVETVAVTTTTAPITTTAPAPPVVTLPATTIPLPTTTTLKSLEDAIAASVVKNVTVDRWACFDAPATCDPTSFTPTVGDLRATVVKLLKESVDAKWRTRRSTDDISYLVVRSVKVAEDRQSAEVVACEWNTEVVFEPNAKVVGGEIPVNIDKRSNEARYNAVRDKDRWLVASEETITAYPPEENRCPPKP